VETADVYVQKDGRQWAFQGGPKGWAKDAVAANIDKEEVDFARLKVHNVHRWLGLVKRVGPPFSAPGDSGALVFSLEDSVTVPLGIHLGAPDEYLNDGMCLSLEAFFY
jgi:hypothetical protein